MERTKSRRTSERKAPEPLNIDYPAMMEEILNMPGDVGNAYNRFRRYSLLNQALLMSQGVTEPINTFRGWQELGRQVQKGSKAKFIIRPITIKRENDKGEEEQFMRFKPVNCLFTVSETEGDDLPEYEPPEWSEKRALGALAINRVAYEGLDGNVAGYSYERNVAVSPVAPYPFKTLMHELGHVVLGHTAADAHAEYTQHRGIAEFQAEATAYLVLNELGATDQMDASVSRGYVQSWLSGEKPDDKAIRAVFSTTDKIVRAGLEPVDHLTSSDQ
ncbi:hypothetical protein BS618_07605 [Rhodococcus erythropolis]|uniref:ArdC-like ssDNA-binding domain-containing protein n=1 Tax=Rhodococcus qingshengii TaxID=334542 RepID=UPI00093569FD|nr:ArdC-like ssDNA-binding domain-containing protein [Rhodococcus qingshengii]MCZ4544941.1 ArdC-like ssDNA-binding domain-containing protein [Rhodococcus qingshengii]OKA15791.1 hypothetical protein BS618_07605 [Rhodococcus erythropolis]